MGYGSMLLAFSIGSNFVCVLSFFVYSIHTKSDNTHTKFVLKKFNLIESHNLQFTTDLSQCP